MKELPDKAHYRPDEVAEYFDMPVKTLYQWIQEGKVKAIRPAGCNLLRIPKDAVEEMKINAVE
jgi:excisionase family DNA binding protein